MSAAALTRREHEVVLLVAEGLTNAEIARELWISPGTVRRHLENVFAKLRVHTRTAAVARIRDAEPHPWGRRARLSPSVFNSRRRPAAKGVVRGKEAGYALCDAVGRGGG